MTANKTHLIETQVYAGRVKDRTLLMKSSSGGAYSVLADSFLKKGAAVAAVVYDYETYQARFTLFTEQDKIGSARGSKYMQSNPGNIFRECRDWLIENPNKELIFFGMGCQAEGFRRYAEISGFRERTTIVDIICHGASSPLIWKAYAEDLEKKHHGKISYLTFKDKRDGWVSPTPIVKIENREIEIHNYVKIFYSECIFRPSCHVCPFATTERQVDITIGDFWHIEKTIPSFFDALGTSVFLLHTARGVQEFEQIKSKLEYRKSNTKECWQKNLETPTPVSENRAAFWNEYLNNGISFVLRKYGRIPIKQRLKSRVKKFFIL